MPDEVQVKLQEALDMLRRSKPSDRSEQARRYAIVITDMEKVCAEYYCLVQQMMFADQQTPG